MKDTGAPSKWPEESIIDSGSDNDHRINRLKFSPITESRISMPLLHPPSSQPIEDTPHPQPPSPSPIMTNHKPRRRAISTPQPFIWTSTPRPNAITPSPFQMRTSTTVPLQSTLPTRPRYGPSSPPDDVANLPLLRPPSPPIKVQRKPKPQISLIIPKDWQGYAYPQE